MPGPKRTHSGEAVPGTATPHDAHDSVALDPPLFVDTTHDDSLAEFPSPVPDATHTAVSVHDAPPSSQESAHDSSIQVMSPPEPISLSDLDLDVEIINETNTYLKEHSTNRNLDKRFNQSQCPVCYDVLSPAVVTPCGHMFCAECLFQSLDHSGRLQPMRRDMGQCPLCRRVFAYKAVQYLVFKKAPLVSPPAAEPAAPASEPAAPASRPTAPTPPHT